LLAIFVVIGISFSLISCFSDLDPDPTVDPTGVPTDSIDPNDPVDYQELLNGFKNDIISEIPQMINQSFSLPTFNGVIVSYALGDQSFTDTFVYSAPFFDVEQTLLFSLRKGNTVVTGSKTFLLVAPDSGRNETKIYLTIPGHIDEVTREQYVPASVLVTTHKNGEIEVEHQTIAAQLRI